MGVGQSILKATRRASKGKRPAELQPPGSRHPVVALDTPTRRRMQSGRDVSATFEDVISSGDENELTPRTRTPTTFHHGSSRDHRIQNSGAGSSQTHSKSSADGSTSDTRECPICLEHRNDVQVLKHASHNGDVSSHMACEDCRLQLPGYKCPFCKEVLVDFPSTPFLNELIERWTNFMKTGCSCCTAAVLEKWQLFEMEVANPSTVRHVLQELALRDELKKLLKSASPCCTCVTLRLYGAIVDKDITVSSETRRLVEECVAETLEPFEEPIAKGEMHGSPYVQAMVYSHAIVMVLAAQSSGCSIVTLAAVAKRAGRFLVSNASTRCGCWTAGARSMLQMQYVKQASKYVWGEDEEDIVLKTFGTTV
eukprot:GFYU01002866.1.p1 GENE.GFYU01002866.1~~GFYU01002866.1.p1  ORF type:complete len:367 (-),score=41.80 GFYU01002866.1:166-1266(-)